MALNQELIGEIEEQRTKIKDALCELKDLFRQADAPHIKNRFDAYIVGALEQACDDFGIHNVCLESLIKELNEELEEPECEDCGEHYEECSC